MLSLHEVTINSRLPEYVTKILHGYKVFLAGGSLVSHLRDIEVSDYDFFGADSAYLMTVVDDLVSNHGYNVLKTKNACTLLKSGQKPIQFITRWCFDNAQAVCDSFDFAICRVVCWSENGALKYLTDPNFYDDYTGNKVTYLKPKRDEDSAGSLLRAFKYAGKGYKVPQETISAVLARFIRDVDSTDAHFSGSDEEGMDHKLLTRIKTQFSFDRGNY